MIENHKYLIVGNGRLARHLKYYFDTLKIPYSEWERRSAIPFDEIASFSESILLPIKDDAIIPFIDSHEILKTKTVVHFSGILSTGKAEGLHPLMTFPQKLYSADFYPKICFVSEKNRPSLSEILPELPNPNLVIDRKDKVSYHAWLTMSGNFTTFIWDNLFNRLRDLGISKNAVLPYLEKTVENLVKIENPLTGPFVRGDLKTIEQHKQALKEDEFGKIYNVFFETYKKIEENENNNRVY